MPPGKSAQSNASLYTAITFVALFLIAATAAIIFYMKYEDQKVLAAKAISDRNEVVKPSEYNKLSTTVGKPAKGKSYIATMLEYFTILDQYITGQVSESNAGAKVTVIKTMINKANTDLGEDASGVFGKDGIDLLFTIRDLKTKLDMERQSVDALKATIAKIEGDFNIVVKKANETETSLLNEVTHWQQKSDTIQAEYDDIRQLREKSTDEQVMIIQGRLDKTKLSLQETDNELQTAKSDLVKTTEELKLLLKEREKRMPQPDREVAAFNPDARVTSVDLGTGLVYLGIGSNDHVYAGLTFMIFDKNNPRPKDGKGKAEIEVFSVMNHVSAARIISSDKRNPISQDDLAVNLIWDSKTSNKFVVIGDFDFNGDGLVDKDGKEKVKQLIEHWSGKVMNDVTIDTDFIVFGSAPNIPQKPTLNQIERDPTLENIYNEAIDLKKEYDKVFIQADRLGVPTFNRSRFFNLIGYETTAKKISPF